VRAIVIEPDRRLAQHEVEEPAPGEGQVRVRVEACGICGSDLHMRPSEAVAAGAIMGHEFAGVVDALGPGVDGWSEGDRVCVYPFEPLDHHDLETAMASGLGLGAHAGGFAESVVVSQSMLWRLPEGMELEHGALVEPLAVALHGLGVGEVQPGDACAVIGAGPIGVMTSLALKARGVENTVVVERNERRRQRIEELGFRSVGLDGVHERALELLGEAPAVVLECAGNAAAPGLAVELVAPSGRIVLLGVLEEPVEISQLLLMLKEAQIRASFAYRPGDFDEAIELIAGGRIPAETLITGREPLERAQEMFDALEQPGTEHLKVLLRP
jgi:(R,R)-butanediol dehydrogenase/meso-butanediol dehydrogenase/diacetyl reductase